MTLDEIADEMRRLSVLLDQGLTALRSQASEYAEAESAYRKAKAMAWVTAKMHSGTVPEKEADVNGATSKERMRRDLADGMRQAALEAVRSRRAQISALQSLLAAHREEAGLARYGPETSP